MIVEGANSPITPLAGDKLYEKGVFVVPDIYVNSGATILAYFEWIKNLSH
jgi:glutamate dehydrogenase (NAD(P)+)